MLRRCGYFTEPDDQLAIIEEFKEISNPVIDFIKELELEGRISNKGLYTQYRYWCEDSGHMPSNKNTFAKRAAKAIREYRDDIVTYRTSTERGYEKKKEFVPTQMNWE